MIASEGRSSSFRAECEAYEDGLAWLAQEATEGDRAVILSLVSRLAKNGVKENWHGLFRKIK